MKTPNGAGPDTTGPALAGTEDEALVQALRNLWPILGAAGRKQAMDTVKELEVR